MFSELNMEQIESSYAAAKARYAAIGVDTEAAMKTLADTPLSLHCWQGDDVRGFEIQEGTAAGGGIMATGNYPGAAGDAQTLRQDAELAFKLIPGKKRFNLHAIYAETQGKKVSRDELAPEHFSNWMAWSKQQNVPLDFNPTFFAHPMAEQGYTLSHGDSQVRRFWIRHAKACREIAAEMGRQQGQACIVNHWIPDGAKDHPMDRIGPRLRLKEALEEIFAEKICPELCLDALECKLFGLGSEDYVVGSHEFYLAYAVSHPQLLCLDMGHFHPTETIHDKLSAIMLFKDEMLLHVSRGLRWDSDHVVLFNEELRLLFQEIVRCELLSRVHLALDFFDASINRVGAWVIGARATQKALLAALLEPRLLLRGFEESGDGAMKLALLEELRLYPLGAVWNKYCLNQKVPPAAAWIDRLVDYDRQIARKR
ncbi:MAG: L-rhamnose isomerase [Lentisphaeria bacterium]|nr:L-rhamnose isomerase [Lentisphaeria bacterium]